MTDTKPDDDTVTWMGVTLTAEFILQLRMDGLNPWLTVMFGYPVPLAPDDPRRIKTDD